MSNAKLKRFEEASRFDEEAERELWQKLQKRVSGQLRRRQQALFAQRPPESLRWRLVVLLERYPEPQIHAFATFEELVEYVKRLTPRDWALPVYGQLAHFAEVENSPLRYLVHPDGQLYPLFAIPERVRLSSSFYVEGESPPDLVSLLQRPASPDDDEYSLPDDNTADHDPVRPRDPGAVPDAEDLEEVEDESEEVDEDDEFAAEDTDDEGGGVLRPSL